MTHDARVPVTDDVAAAKAMLDHAFRHVGTKALRDVAFNDIVAHFAARRLAGVAAGREEVSAAIRELRLAEAAYADGKTGAVDRLDAALKALFAYEVSAIRERGE